MKFNHKFKLEKSSKSSKEYSCGNIAARIDFISQSAIRVAIYNKGEALLPTFNVNPENELSKKGRERLSTEGFDMCEADFHLPCGVDIELDLNNFLLSYYIGGKLLFSDRKPLAYNLEKEFGNELIHYVSREEGERIFGAGDKGGSLDKSGRAFKIETTDSMGYNAASTDPLYKHIPFYICENSAGSYGVFYDTSCTSYFDFGKEVNNYYEPYKYFKTTDNCLVYYVFFGSKLEIVQQFGRLCGKQAFPPKWSFEYCASTMAYTDAPDSEKHMNGFLDKISELDLACGGFYLSSGYTSIGNQRCVFNWNREKFPNPQAFIKHFSDSGIQLIPNIKPAFLNTHPMYEMLSEKGFFVKNPDSSPFITQFWDGYGSYLDFTNPEAFEFWKSKVKETLLDYGIKATWNDNNEFDIKDTEALAGDLKANEIRPSLTYLMVLSSYFAQIEKYPALRPFLSTRSGGIGVRRLAQTWSGDNRSAFEDLRYCHYIGLTMSLSGLHFYGHDLGGFTGDMPSRELLLRWLQHGVFEPRFTIHSWNKDGSATMPWSYEDIIPSVKELFDEREELLPYLYNCAYNAVESEIPINAPLWLYYNSAKEADGNAFMVGKDLLAACVFDEGETKVEVTLPEENDWYFENELIKGGTKKTVEISPYGRIPYFVRAGSVVPKGRDETLVVYPIEEGEFSAEFFTDDGKSFAYLSNDCVKLGIKVNCLKDRVELSFQNEGNMDYSPKFALCSADDRELVIKN